VPIDTKGKRGSAIGVNPLSPILPEADGTISAADRGQLVHVYGDSSGSSTPMVTGSSTLFVDQDVEIIKLTLARKDAPTSTVTYYFGLEYRAEDEVYPGSPVIYPLLVSSPEAHRGIGNTIANRYDVTVGLFAKTDLDRRGYTLLDLMNDFEFHNAAVEVRYYAKTSGQATTHSDAVNIRETLTVIGASYDDGNGTLSLQCRDTLFKTRDYGHRFDVNDFGANVDTYINTWRTEQAPIAFGTDPTDLRGVTVSVCPVRYAFRIPSGSNLYQQAQIVMGLSPGAPSAYAMEFLGLYAQNQFKDVDPLSGITVDQSNWLLLYVPPVAYASRTPIAGPATLSNGTKEFSGRQWRLARQVTTSLGAYPITGVSFRARRVGVLTKDDGQLTISFYRAKNLGGGNWALVGGPLRQLAVDATLIGTTAGNIDFHFNPLFALPKDNDYLVVAEWTRHSVEEKTIDYATWATPIEVTTSGEHGWETGDSVTIAGSIGNTAINGTWPITKHPTDKTKFTLDGSVGSGTYAIPITGASKKHPIEITTAVNHGLVTGDEVVITGVDGNSAANGTFPIKVTALNKFTLDGTTYNGTYQPNGSATVNLATNTSPIRITTSSAHNLEDGDIVQIFGVVANPYANGIWRVQKVDSLKFDLDGSDGTASASTGTGGTVQWGGFVQRKTKVERNKYVAFYVDESVHTDSVYTNDPSVSNEGWAASLAQFQLQVWGLGMASAGAGFVAGDHTINCVVVDNLASGQNPVEFAGLDLKVGVRGLKDDAFGTFTGTPGALIDNPVSIIMFLLLEPVFGIGLDPSRLDLAAFYAVRDSLGSTKDMAFVIEQVVDVLALISKICDQSGLIFYKLRDGRLTIARPVYPSSYPFSFSEGEMRGDFLLESLQDNDETQVINSMEGTYRPDALLLNTDPALIRISRDSRELGLEYIYGNGTGFSAPESAFRPPQALASAALYGLRESKETYDLYYSPDPVRTTMAYKFDRYHRLQKRVTFRIPRKRFYTSSLDLLTPVRVAAFGIPGKTAATENLIWHDNGTPVPWFNGGPPIAWCNAGFLEGLVLEIIELGPFMTVIVETISPF
jgi:hypothetical protein